MIVLKFTKTGSAAFIPHLDLLRAFCYALRRKGLSVKFSEGFNPHARLFFNQPPPLGCESLCEYVAVDIDVNAKKLTRLRLPQGVKLLAAAAVDGNPNLAAIIERADYTVKLYKKLPPETDFSKLLGGENLIISYKTIKGVTEKDVKPLIYSVKNTASEIYLNLAAGNQNLRADRLTAHLLNSVNLNSEFDVIKTAVYNKDNVDLDRLYFPDPFTALRRKQSP